MGVTQSLKPIFQLSFRNFYPQNVQEICTKIIFSQPNADWARGLSELSENRRLCRITSNTSLCVLVVRP